MTDFRCAIVPARDVLSAPESWLALADEALEANASYEPAMIGAMIDHLPGHSDLQVVTVHRDRQLVGLLPFHRQPLGQGGLPGAASLLFNPYVTSTAPLLHRSAPDQVWRWALSALREAGFQTLLCPMVVGRAPLFDAILPPPSNATLRVSIIFDRSRAAIDAPGIDHAAYLARYSPKRRKGVATRRRKAEALGKVRVEVARGWPATREPLDIFLSLESSGWKGRGGTALACRPETEAMARAIVARGGDRIHIETLWIGDRPAASNFNMIAQNNVYTFKSAYDETLHEVSPGAMLDDDLLRRVLAGDYNRADSCAAPDHRLSQEWLERDRVLTFLTATSADVAPARVALATAIVRVARGGRARLKRWLKRS